jgi:hypothetical protein
VIFGGIATMLHAEDTIHYADSVFLGESEGRMEQVLKDWKKASSKKCIIIWESCPLLNWWALPGEICTKENFTIIKACKW